MSREKKVSILLVGVGGFGGQYIDLILKHSDRVRLVGGVDTNDIPQETVERLSEHQTRFYKSMEEFYAENSADLCIISTPIHLHKEQTFCALSHGSNVLCEKPVAGSLSDVEEMIAAQGEKFVAVGFQHCFADNLLRLKRDILNGVWGKPKLFKTLTFFPRSTKYFTARSWSGKIKSADGRMINDNIVNNACAHSLQALLFLLGDKIESAASPTNVDVRLYNANKLETFDTAALWFETDADTPILYFASHATKEKHGRELELFFENGSVIYSEVESTLKGTFNNGKIIDYGWSESNEEKFLKCVMAAEGEMELVTCDLKTALPHTLAVEMVMSQLDKTYVFKENETQTYTKKDNTFIFVPGLQETLLDAYKDNKLPDIKIKGD